MTKIISAIIAFLLMLFPTSGNLLATQQQLSFPGEKAAANQIIEAIKGNDIDALIDMYCVAAKSTGEVTTENLQNFIDTIEGDIKKGEYFLSDSSDYSNKGHIKSHRQIKIKITTSQQQYLIYASWVVADTETPERVGLLQLTLFPYEDPVVIAQVPLKGSIQNAGY